MQDWDSDSRSALRVRPHPAGQWFDMPTWRSDASASHTPSRQSLLDEKSVSSRSGTFWFSSSAHLVVDSSGSLPFLSLPHSAVRNFCTDGKNETHPEWRARLPGLDCCATISSPHRDSIRAPV